MDYPPITDQKKLDWISWLQDVKDQLNGREENKNDNSIFGTPEGDIATAKDLIGNLLATLSNKTITIN